MTEELLVNVSPLETRVALLEQGMVQDLHIERTAHRGIVGNIYLGKVIRVMPGMQAAFVDIGEARTSFIHARDISPLDAEGMEQRATGKAVITDLVREGQTLMVQVTKEPLGTKGARLTTQISLSSRYLVYLPRTRHIGVSQQIESEAERERLRGLLQAGVTADSVEPGLGFIIRTAAEGASEAEFAADLRFLDRVWRAVSKRGAAGAPPQRIYEDWALSHRAVRDLARPGLERIRIDDAATATSIRQFCEEFVPELAARVEHYQGARPLFEMYGVDEEIDKALGRQVALKSGGHLVIDQTEAMTTIDVNTGSFVGRSNPDDTIFKTNLEAAVTLARQVRVRNLGGIIIIDFIDMRQAEHGRQVLRALEKAMARDSAKVAITGVSELGLVEMTRQRTRDSLGHTLCEPCPVCDGRGELQSAETVCYGIFREILREAREYESAGLLVRAAQEVVDRLLDEEATAVADLEEFTGKTVQLRVEPVYSREQFDIIPV